MKKWNTPAIAEVNVSDTASGLWPGSKERGFLNGHIGVAIFGSHPVTCPGHNTPTPDPEDGYKDDNKDIVDQNS